MPLTQSVGRFVKGMKMNDQFVKTLEALEAAENEMAELHNVLDSLECVNRAEWHETQTAADYRQRLSGMQKSIRAMLGKREKALLEGVRAQHTLHLTRAGCGEKADEIQPPAQVS